MLYYDTVDVPEDIDVNKTSESKELMFVTIRIFYIKVLNFSSMSAIGVTMY